MDKTKSNTKTNRSTPKEGPDPGDHLLYGEMAVIPYMTEGKRKLMCWSVYREFHLWGQLDSSLIEA